MTTRFVGLAVAAGGILWPAALPAQWQIGIGVARETYTGVSRGSFEGDDASFRPHRPLVWSLRVEAGSRGPRAAIRLSHSTPDLALVGTEVSIVPHETLLRMIAASPTIILPIATFPAGPRLELEAGPLWELWRLQGEDDQQLWGGRGGLALMVDLGRKVSLRISGHLAVTPRSPLAGALIENYEGRAAWKRGLEGVVMLRL